MHQNRFVLMTLGQVKIHAVSNRSKCQFIWRHVRKNVSQFDKNQQFHILAVFKALKNYRASRVTCLFLWKIVEGKFSAHALESWCTLESTISQIQFLFKFTINSSFSKPMAQLMQMFCSYFSQSDYHVPEDHAPLIGESIFQKQRGRWNLQSSFKSVQLCMIWQFW